MSPGQYIYLVLLGSLLKSLVCKADMILVVALTIAVQNRPQDQQAIKFGRMMAAKYLGNIASFTLQGILLEVSNFAYCFMVSIAIYFVIALVIFICLEDKTYEDTNTKKEKQCKSPCGHCWNGMSIMTQKPKGGSLLDLWAVMVIVFLLKAASASEYAVTVLYVNKNIPSFTSSDFSWYWIAEKLGNILVATLGVSCFKKLNINDIITTIFAASTCIVEFSMLSVTYSVLMLYISTLIGSFSTFLITTSQSLISLIVSEEHHGKAYSLYFCFESLANILGPTIFLAIYKHSLLLFSGLTFTIMAASYLCVLIAAVYLKFSLDYAKNTTYNSELEEVTLLKDGDNIEN